MTPSTLGVAKILGRSILFLGRSIFFEAEQFYFEIPES
jgi:hypothetical protein